MLSIHIADRFRKLFRGIKKQQDAWIVFFGLITVSLLGFEAGLISGKSGSHQEPLRIELAPVTVSAAADAEPVPLSAGIGERTSAGERKTMPAGASCLFVASRNSKLYHAAGCAVVKRIKPENRLCFKEASEAVARGLAPGCTQ